MYAVVNMPVSLGLRRRFMSMRSRRRPRVVARLCRFSECDKDATSSRVGPALCALHESLFNELAAVKAHPSRYMR